MIIINANHICGTKVSYISLFSVKQKAQAVTRYFFFGRFIGFVPWELFIFDNQGKILAKAKHPKKTLFSVMKQSTGRSEVFLKLDRFFWNTVILYIIFLIIKIHNFWGDLSNISARTATARPVDVVFADTSLSHPETINSSHVLIL